MIGCLQTRVHKLPIIALYFESENELKFYNLEAWSQTMSWKGLFWKKNADNKKSMQNYPACKELNNTYYINNLLH